MNILIRTDSSSKIGTGHIMRDLVLARQFPNDTVTFATQELENNINYKIIESGYALKVLENNRLETLIKTIELLKIDMLIIDHYDIDYSFEKELKKYCKSLKILVVDDNYVKHHCDILLNHNIFANKKLYKYLVPSTCKVKCGAKYTLLRDEFKDLEKIKRDKKNIFIGMGGSDNQQLNIKIIKTINKTFSNKLNINIATTSANKNLAKLDAYCQKKTNISLYINSEKIASLMAKCSFAIISPSVMANEAYFLNTPFICIKTADNQKNMYDFLKKSRFLCMKKFNKESLKKYLKQMSNR